jgi:NADH dehydrogenase
MRGRQRGVVATLLGIAAILAVRQARERSPQQDHTHRSTLGSYQAARHRVLILGGGFGGLAVAQRLDALLGDRSDVSVLVVDRNSALLFTPLLWTVADGRVNPNDVVVPIRAFQHGRSFHLLHAEVEQIDLERREVQTSAGARPYDSLVIALGSMTAVPDLSGLREHALRFHSPADAMELRNHLIDAVEHAHQTADVGERTEWLTFVVGGGGDTGIELAATIRDYLRSGLLAAYPWLAGEEPRIVVVGRAERLVPMSTPATSARVEQVLQGEGIEVWTGVAIEGLTDRAVQTSRGEIPARTVFWAAGISAPSVVRDLPVDHARNGAILVDERLQVPGHPEVFVVGDAAWAYDGVTGEPAPPTAQAAEHMGAYAGEVIAGLIDERPTPPFQFQTRGRLALLGHRTGVAEIAGLVFTGIPAWLLWHVYYLSKIPSWRNRVRLVTDLLLAGLTGRETALLRLESAGASSANISGEAERASS